MSESELASMENYQSVHQAQRSKFGHEHKVSSQIIVSKKYTSDLSTVKEKCSNFHKQIKDDKQDGS